MFSSRDEPWTACTRTIFHWRVDETRLGGRGKGDGGRDGRSGKREEARGLEITGCAVSPFDPPVTVPIDRARVYIRWWSRARQGKGRFIRLKARLIDLAAVTGYIDVYVHALETALSTFSRPAGRPSYPRARKEDSARRRGKKGEAKSERRSIVRRRVIRAYANYSGIGNGRREIRARQLGKLCKKSSAEEKFLPSKENGNYLVEKRTRKE